MFDTAATTLQAAFAGAGRQLGGTFLVPGSTFSIAALLCSFAIFTALCLRGKRRRPIRLAVLRRALLPNRLVKTASGLADLAYFVLGILLAGVAIGWAVFAAGDIRATIAPLLGSAPAPRLPGWLSATVMTLALFLAYEFAYWLDHWLKHRTAFFWHFHKVHHQAESLSLFTNGRVHPVDTIVFYNIVAAMLGVTGAVGERLLGAGVAPFDIGGTNLLVMLTSVALAHLQHSHLWLDFGPRWSRVLLGPAHHQIHHSAAPEHHDRNLGNTLAVFDRAFGTFFAPPESRGAIRFGVEDGERDPHGFRAALVTPFVAAVGTVARPVARFVGSAQIRRLSPPTRL